MPQYRVHLYPVVRVPMLVEADTPQAATELAASRFSCAELRDAVDPDLAGTDAIVDLIGDDDYENTVCVPLP